MISNPKEKPLLASQTCTKPYENATFGLSILRPCGWAIQENASSDGHTWIRVANFHFPNKTGTPDTSLAIYVDDLSSRNVTLNEYLGDASANYETLPDFRLISSNTDKTLASNSAYEILATYVDPTYGTQSIGEIGTIKADKVLLQLVSLI